MGEKTIYTGIHFSNLIWWVQKTFLKIFGESHHCKNVKFENLGDTSENDECTTHLGELQGSLYVYKMFWDVNPGILVAI